MRNKQAAADLALGLAVLIWGVTFTMVKEAMAKWPALTFLSARFWIAFLGFVPVLWLWAGGLRPALAALRAHARPSAWAAVALLCGYTFQTLGLRFTTSSKAAFITGISVVLVPLGAMIMLRQKIARSAQAGVLLAAVGLVLLTLNDELWVEKGDVLELLCAASFAGHILLVGQLAPRCQPLPFAAGQVLFTAAGCSILAAVFDLRAGWPPPPDASLWLALCFTGLLATSFCFWVQTAAQRFTSATHAALIFSLEPVCAAAWSRLTRHEELTLRMLIGSALILGGMLTAELGSVLQRRNAARRAMAGDRA